MASRPDSILIESIHKRISLLQKLSSKNLAASYNTTNRTRNRTRNRNRNSGISKSLFALFNGQSSGASRNVPAASSPASAPASAPAPAAVAPISRQSIREQLVEAREQALQALQSGANPNAADKFPVLYLAVENGDAEMVDILLEYGADPRLNLGDERYTFIRAAVASNNFEIFNSLLRVGAEIIDSDKAELTTQTDYKIKSVFARRELSKRNQISNAYMDYDPRSIARQDKDKSIYFVKSSNATIPKNESEKSKYLLRNDPWYTLYTRETFPDAPDGIYTWIYSQKYGFFALRTYSFIELGTKHAAILSRVRHLASSLVGAAAGGAGAAAGVGAAANAAAGSQFKFSYAGELRKEGNKIFINLQSGTYTWNFIQAVAASLKMDKFDLQDILLDYALADLRTIFKDRLNVESDDNFKKSMITMDLTNEEIDRLKSRGFTVSERNKNSWNMNGGTRRKRRGCRITLKKRT